ncbi:MAG: glutamate--tRNA ligase [Alphaproteobacteria bacterium]|nr:glutamate--tRNA ligase [Alphaproteobacteria bacterium]
MTSDAVVTRIAPSPTGRLHIGTARTALFNWLYARHTGGQFRLRIEDTDRVRSTTEAIEAILHGLEWLGLNWDGEVVYQSLRADRHRAVAEQMLAAGRAYLCYASPEELQEMRERALAEGRQPRYDGRWRDRDPADAPPGVAPVIRLRAATEGETVVEDKVQGRVTFRNADLDDLVLMRSDGTPTYMLAVVVDDQDMGVTHVIRGDDHLNNAARQLQILNALGWTAPVYAHIPLIHGPDGAKLSKRHGALGIEAYREMGYLPEALRSYLMRLGWSHGNEEIISDADAIAWFDLDSLNRAPARLDLARLAHINAHYLRQRTPEGLVELIVEARGALDPVHAQRLQRAAHALANRSETVPELLSQAEPLLLDRPLAIDGKASKLLGEEARARLTRLASHLARLPDWRPDALAEALPAFADAEGVSFGKVGPAARAALVAGRSPIDLSDLLYALGREESLARLSEPPAAD